MSGPMPSELRAPTLDPALRARVLEAVQREPVATREAGAKRRARMLAVGFAVWAGILVVSLFLGPTPRPRPPGYVVALALAWLSIALIATWAGVGQGRSMLGRATPWRIAVAALTPVALLVVWAFIARLWPSTLSGPSGPPEHLVCNVMTLVFAGAPLVAFGLLRRHSDPINPGLTGATLAAAAAAWGALAMHVRCGFTSVPHMLIGHVVPVVLITVAGAVWLARAVAIRN